MRKIRNPWIGKDGYACMGCCPDNAMGLKMEFFEDGGEVVCFWKPQPHHQGWNGVMHGGVAAALADEIGSWVVFRRLQTAAMTARLEMRWRKPVATGEEMITLRATLAGTRRNMAMVDVSLANARGEECVTARVTYQTFPTEQARDMGFEPFELEDEQLLF